MKISNIRKMQSDIRPQNGHKSEPRASQMARILHATSYHNPKGFSMPKGGQKNRTLNRTLNKVLLSKKLFYAAPVAEPRDHVCNVPSCKRFPFWNAIPFLARSLSWNGLAF